MHRVFVCSKIKHMNYKITYIISRDLLSVKTNGKMDAVDISAMGKDLLEHPRCLPNSDVVFDHTVLGFYDAPVEDL